MASESAINEGKSTKFFQRLNQLYAEKSCDPFFVFDNICEETGLRPTNLRNILNGNTPHPSYDKVVSLAKYFGVSVAYLVGEIDEKNIGENTGVFSPEEYGLNAALLEGLLRLRKSKHSKLGFLALRFLVNYPISSDDKQPEKDNDAKAELLLLIAKYLFSNSMQSLSLVDNDDLDTLAELIDEDDTSKEDYRDLALKIINEYQLYDNDRADVYNLHLVAEKLKQIRTIIRSTQDAMVENVLETMDEANTLDDVKSMVADLARLYDSLSE